MINNRQNGRRRGRGGARPQNGANNLDRGSRLDNRARGNASQLHEKYKTLARDAQMQGDRVMTEYYLQFADHYFRVLSENRSRFEEQQQRRERYDNADFDEEEGDTGEERAQDSDREDRRDRQPRPERESRREEGRADQDRAPRETARRPRDETVSDELPLGDAAEQRRPRGRRARPSVEDAAPARDERIEVDRLPPAFAAEPAQDADGADQNGEEKPRRRTRRTTTRAASADTAPAEA